MVKNYGVAVILFTIAFKFIMLPLSIKQQKSMAAQSKLALKQQEIQKMYPDNKQKQSEELQKLYQKENVSPMSGCLLTLLPFPIMIGIYYSVIYPLKNTLHIASDVVNEATAFIAKIPGVSSSVISARGEMYNEMVLVKHFSSLKDYLTMFTAEEKIRIEEFSKSFDFLGLNLLDSPNTSPLSSMLWLIPVICLIVMWGQQFYMSKKQNAGQKQQGCMKWMLYLLPLMSVYFSYIMPGAVGFYWIVSAVCTFAQSIYMYKYYSPAAVSAKAEAQRAALRFSEEKLVYAMTYAEQRQMEEKIASAANNYGANQQNKKTSNKKKKK